MKDLWAWEIIRGGTLYLRPGGNNLYSHIREGVIRRQGLPTIVPRYRDPQLCHATLYLNLVIFSYTALTVLMVLIGMPFFFYSLEGILWMPCHFDG